MEWSVQSKICHAIDRASDLLGNSRHRDSALLIARHCTGIVKTFPASKALGLLISH